jgi:hypothetical protein
VVSTVGLLCVLAALLGWAWGSMGSKAATCRTVGAVGLADGDGA